jgi:hypothetical protein
MAAFTMWLEGVLSNVATLKAVRHLRSIILCF